MIRPLRESVPHSRIAHRFSLPALATRTVKAFGIGESAVAERLGELLTAPPDGVEAGIYARDDGVHARFSTRGELAPLDRIAAEAVARLGEAAYGTDDDDELILRALMPEADLKKMREAGPLKRTYPLLSSPELDQVAKLMKLANSPVVQFATADMSVSLRR